MDGRGGIFLAAGIMAVVAAPFLYFATQNRAEIPSQIHDPEVFSHDPQSYLLPSEVIPGRTLIWPTFARLHSYRDNGGFDAYLGLPLILILLLQLRELQRRPYLKPLLLSLLAIVILSLGPTLHIAGVTTSIWLPWRLAHRVSAILVGPGTPAALVAAISALHWQGTNAHGVQVVRVPDPRSLHFTR